MNDIERERRKLDDAEDAEQARNDQNRELQRDVRDQTRQQSRGDRQSHEGLRRERDTEDASLRAERTRTGETRRLERELVDAIVDREKDERTVRQTRRAEETKELLLLVREQLLVVATNLDHVLSNVPRGTLEGRLGENVGAIRAAIARVDTLVTGATNPDDRGGSG